MTLYTTTDSPIGELLLVGDGEALRGLHMQDGATARAIDRDWTPAREPFEDALGQLAEYFSGTRTRFELPLAPGGTAFQQAVWSALLEIPYGETRSYGELARKIGRPRASRAVGAANGRNPIAIVVPCHRVIGSDGSLTGFGGGVQRKELLLGLERDVARPRMRVYKLLGADGTTYESTTPGTLGGHRRNRGYGRLDCPTALSWIARGKYVEHRVFFADERTAIRAGYRPCGACMPDRYREWKHDPAAFAEAAGAR